MPLFSRSGREIALTDEGSALLTQLTQGFQIVREAIAQPEPNRHTLKVGAFPFLANEVLTPGIDALKKTLGGDIRLYTQNSTELLTHAAPQERLDVVIRYAKVAAKFPGLIAQKLTNLTLVPVIAINEKEPSTAGELMAKPLARVIGPFDGWQLWRQTYASEISDVDYALETDSYHSAMLAVARGEVACLAVAPFIQPWLNSGRVKALASWQVDITEQAAFMVYARHNEGNPSIDRFGTWLAEQWL